MSNSRQHMRFAIFDSSKNLEPGKVFPAGATTASTNVLDLGAIADKYGNAIQEGLGDGARPLGIQFLPTADGTGANAVTLLVEDSADNSTFNTIAQEVIAAGSSIKKGVPQLIALPGKHRRYLRASVTCGATTTFTGRIDPGTLI